MKTLIELYSTLAIENVLGPETFRPERVVYLCPPEIAADKKRAEALRRFFRERGLAPELLMTESDLFDAEDLLRQLRALGERYEDIAVDVGGGTDAALFAAGRFCQSSGTPAFTYSRHQNRFYNLCHADFAAGLPCTLRYSVADFFRMAGGRLRQGRVDNSLLMGRRESFTPFFRVFLRYRRGWTDAILYLQRISQPGQREEPELTAEGAWTQKGEHGRAVQADPALLADLQAIGFIHDLSVTEGERVRFTFADAQTRAWLRDVGSVLELYTWNACVEAGIFDDIISSAVVDWDDAAGRDNVCNEIDVVAARGVLPLFISCKACEVRTEALNELAILRDRFGGKGAKAVIVTTENCCAAARHRAAQLGIAVLDLEELENGRAADRLRVIMKVEKQLAEK